MEAKARFERPGVVTGALFKIGERMFGQVPTPERLMAHRLPMMVGLGGLQTAIERFGTIETAATRAAQPPGGDALRRASIEWTSITPSA